MADDIIVWFCPVCATLTLLEKAAVGECAEEPPRTDCPLREPREARRSATKTGDDDFNKGVETSYAYVIQKAQEIRGATVLSVTMARIFEEIAEGILTLRKRRDAP